MSYHLINTDLKHMHENPSQYWLDNQCACTKGPIEPYGARGLGGLAEGDILFMYENGTGIIAAGSVTHPWDGNTHHEAGIYAGEFLYKIRVNWFADIRYNPIGIPEIRELGYGRFTGTRIPVRNDNTSAAILAGVNRRGGHVPPM